VRELRNALERARHMVDIPEMAGDNLLREFTREAPAAAGDFLPVEFTGPFKVCKDELIRAFEREFLTRLLGRARGNIARAAREAELDRKHLYSLLHKYGLVQSEGE
jgi:DNA-binding NtrC family response regulator